jgi:hypothetical protein
VSMRGTHQGPDNRLLGGLVRVRLMRTGHRRDMGWPVLMLSAHQGARGAGFGTEGSG